MIFEYKWPHANPNMKLIKSLENKITIHNNNTMDKVFYEYACNFKKSARIVVDKLVNNQNISELDSYFFSVAFLYRHSLELLLKAIGFKSIQNAEEGKLFIKDTFHNLSGLFESIIPFINCIDLDRVEWLREYFNSINSMDKESDSFRYPFSIKFKKDEGNPKTYFIEPFFAKQTHIDLVSFVNKIEAAFSILNSFYKESATYDELYKDYSPTFLDEGGNYRLQSVIGYNYQRQRFYPLIRAYTECAQLLFLEYKNNKYLGYTIFFPMTYLFRNGLELSMKEILFEECNLDFQTSAKLLKDCSHNVNKLWKNIKPEIIKHSLHSEDNHTLDYVEKYICQVHDFDGASDKFRYPTNKYLNFYFNKKTNFDIENIYEFFTEVNNFFGGASSMMSSQNELLADMEAEYRAEMQSYYDYY
ncbi:hypothetical protein [Solibacillus sp. FSL H8-0538]|uniref:hypothetical protein n=1 Tax=Solibacillus sp. FSL H8-0538 TaxID=2921400 RepID=UPI0030F93D01